MPAEILDPFPIDPLERLQRRAPVEIVQIDEQKQSASKTAALVQHTVPDANEAPLGNLAWVPGTNALASRFDPRSSISRVSRTDQTVKHKDHEHVLRYSIHYPYSSFCARASLSSWLIICCRLQRLLGELELGTPLPLRNTDPRQKRLRTCAFTVLDFPDTLLHRNGLVRGVRRRAARF